MYVPGIRMFDLNELYDWEEEILLKIYTGIIGKGIAIEIQEE